MVTSVLPSLHSPIEYIPLFWYGLVTKKYIFYELNNQSLHLRDFNRWHEWAALENSISIYDWQLTVFIFALYK